MSENERLADQMMTELLRAIAQYACNLQTAEQFIGKLRIIFKAANL